MAAMDRGVERSGDRARMYGACAGCALTRMASSPNRVNGNTLPSELASNSATVKFSGELCKSSQKMAITSRWTAIWGRGTRPIRKKIIGHSMTASRGRFARGSRPRHLRRPLALLHQPARQHGGGILLEPLVEKRGDLFPEISGMAEAREFIALQRGARGREKELPGWLGLLAVHAVLREYVMNIITR
jgi:hypothetical protein